MDSERPARPSELFEDTRSRRRLTLGRSRRRLSFERRIRLWIWLLSLPALAMAVALLRIHGASYSIVALVLGALMSAWAISLSFLMEQIVRPLQTLANVVAALREDDYSFRARGGRRDDAVGDLAIEVNALAATLQARRNSAMEAMALLDRVMGAMQAPVFAFSPDGRLHLLNPAAERAFQLQRESAIGKYAAELRLEHVRSAAHDELITGYASGNVGGQPRAMPTRWVVQKSPFRLRGLPHILIMLSDVSAALREEERVAWQRLIRVMGHEINNSLTPIKSIAGSLLAQPPAYRRGDDGEADLMRGLSVIENRAESLNRFLQAYGQLAGLPAPTRSLIALGPLLERVCGIETRVDVRLDAGLPTMLDADEDQLQQAFINLVKNGADATLLATLGDISSDALKPETAQAEGARENSTLVVTWEVAAGEAVIYIRDTGAGIANESNLFVPFYTTKAQGTGIGLVLSLQIIEGHGGSVRLRNRTDMRGCEAEVRLPVPSQG